ncbi:hypothetical protein EMCG_05693 [[Emmonsia] crescens]|uniref:Ndc10 domain-containing protein n=1 Tax=[Emmonsia] crescens TaxID=73230 RepID=A0A0G2IED6_9EURO|nr:hypothetical protein EMCG_05693 [Emmonsia crescens UAMH 3008]
MGHNMLLRGESRCMTELADLFTLELDNEGPTLCFPMVLIMSNGKTNQMGWIEYATEPLPQFHRREKWYNLHLIKGADPRVKMAYETQLDWVNRVFNRTGLIALKKTHAGRANGARTAELAEVSDSQIRRAGRWNSDALSQFYLTNIPRKFVRAMAGFNPNLEGGFYLPRACVSPPDELVQAIWPWIS